MLRMTGLAGFAGLPAGGAGSLQSSLEEENVGLSEAKDLIDM